MGKLSAARIPQLIHQTWKNEQPPDYMRDWQTSWKKHNVEWKYRLWTDRDNLRLVTEHYPWLLPLYEGYPEEIMRIDLARCLILHRYGGLYADLDFECLKPMNPLLEGAALVFCTEPHEHIQRWNKAYGKKHPFGDKVISNAWMASIPGHPFWDTVFQHMLKNSSRTNAVMATGPFVITESWYSRQHWSDAVLLESPQLFPVTAAEAEAGAAEEILAGEKGRAAYAVHHWAGTWWRGVRLRHYWHRLRHQFIGNNFHLTAVLWLLKILRAGKRKVRSWIKPPPPLHQPLTARPRKPLSESQRSQKILIAVPVKNAARFISGFVENLQRLDYPHRHLSLVFLESDSTDGTSQALQQAAQTLRDDFAQVSLLRCDFGYRSRRVRYDSREQLVRRAVLARSRNLILEQALGDHDWVLWIDVDVQWWPAEVLDCLLSVEREIVVPNCLTPYGDDFDLNSFRIAEGMKESDWSPWIKDGLLQPPKGLGRLYLNQLRDEDCAPIDAVGATMLLVKADLHRAGIIFPEAPYRNYIETEGLSMLAADRGYRSWGMPNLEIIHPLS